MLMFYIFPIGLLNGYLNYEYIVFAGNFYEGISCLIRWSNIQDI